MNTAIAIGLLVVVALMGLELLWDWRRSGRLFCTPLPRPYRDRDSQQGIWQGRFDQDELACINAVLVSFCAAFSFNPDDRYKLGPDDQIMAIYRALYPRWKFWQLGDSLEIETLMMDLRQRFGIEAHDWHPGTSLADLVGLVGHLNSPAE
jgi:propanediol dehydratase small subunit